MRIGWLISGVAALTLLGVGCEAADATAPAEVAEVPVAVARVEQPRAGAGAYRGGQGRPGQGRGMDGARRGGKGAHGKPRADRVAQGGPGGGERKAQREEVEQKIKALRVYQLTELLELDQAASEAFFPKLSRFDDSLRTLRREHMMASRALREALAPGGGGASPEASAIEPLLRRAVEVEAQEAKLRADFMAEVEQSMGPVKAAHFLVYQQDFERQLRRLLHAAMRGATDAEQSELLQELQKAGRLGDDGPPPPED